MVQLKLDKKSHPATLEQSFNSCMVQLKSEGDLCILPSLLRFNSCMVQLKSRITTYPRLLCARFNSCMVQLKSTRLYS